MASPLKKNVTLALAILTLAVQAQCVFGQLLTTSRDVIAINDALQTIRINGVTTSYDSNTPLVRIADTGGDDVLTYLSGPGPAKGIFIPNHVIFDTPSGTRIVITGVESVRFNGASGDDTAEFYGTTSDDEFVSSVGSARMTSGTSTFEVSGEIDVLTRGGGGNDFALVHGSALDDVVDIISIGEQAFVERPDATISILGFPRVQINADQGGFDSATIEDSPATDMLAMEGPDTIFITPSTEIDLMHFEEVDANSRNGGMDMVEFHDIPSEFDEFSGATTDADPSWFISAETLSHFDGSNYSNIARNFEFTDYFPNYVDSRMRIIDSVGDDYIADPREDHSRETTLERRGIAIFNYLNRRGIANTTIYIANRGGFDTVDGFNVASAIGDAFPSAEIDQNSISSFGPERLRLQPRDADVYFAKKCLIARDAEQMNFHADTECNLKCLDSRGNDVFVFDADTQRMELQYPNRTIVATGELVIEAQSENGGDDQFVCHSRGSNIVVSHLSVDFVQPNATFPALARHSATGFASMRIDTDGGSASYVDSPGFDHVNAFGNVIEIDSGSSHIEIFDAPNFTSGGSSGGPNTATIASTSNVSFRLPPGNWDRVTFLGDINQDGEINFLDIAPFISVLTSSGFQDEADMNQDGVVNLLDINSLIIGLRSQ